ncbi:MAG: hypothetical protein ACM3S0_10460 [Acidobacteriota bacterium]
MNTERDRSNFDWGLWLAWVLASAVGYSVGVTLGFVIPDFVKIDNPAAPGIVFGIVVGGVGGLAQWLVLRRWITGINLWVPATGLGFAIAVGIAASINPPEGMNSNAWIAVVALLGVTGGLVQWLILRKQGMGLGWWLAASLLGALLGGALGNPAMAAILSGSTYSVEEFIMIVLGIGAALGLGLGVTTGSTLAWLQRHPKSGLRAAAAQNAR